MAEPSIFALAIQILLPVLAIGGVLYALRFGSEKIANVTTFVIEAFVYVAFALIAPFFFSIILLIFSSKLSNYAFDIFSVVFKDNSYFIYAIYIIAGPLILWIESKYGYLLQICAPIVLIDAVIIYDVGLNRFYNIDRNAGILAAAVFYFHVVALSAGVLLFMRLVKVMIGKIVDSFIRPVPSPPYIRPAGRDDDGAFVSFETLKKKNIVDEL